MLQASGKFLILLGMILFLVGIVLLAAPSLSQIPFLRHLGKLPGDIAVRRDGFQFYFPLTTSILISAVLSGIFWLIQILRR